MSKLTSPLQLKQSVIIHASVEKTWNIFNDQSLLPKWTNDVQKSHYTRKMAAVGEARDNECIVNGKPGRIVSRCLLLEPFSRAEFMVENDSYAMNKMLGGVSFAAVFNKIDEDITEFIMQSHYQPKKFFIKLMNGLVRKKMAREVEIMLDGLKNYVETGETNKLNPINR